MAFLNALRAGREIGQDIQQQGRQAQLRNALAKGDLQAATAIDPRTGLAAQQEQRLGRQQQLSELEAAQEQQKAQQKQQGQELAIFSGFMSNPEIPFEIKREALVQREPQLKQAGIIDPQSDLSNLKEDQLNEAAKRISFRLMQNPTVFENAIGEQQKQALGFGGGDQTSRQRQIKELEDRGFPTEVAQDVVSGRLETVPDDFGNINVINTLTGEVVHRVSTRTGQNAQPQGGQEAQAQTEQSGFDPQATQLGQAAIEGTGPIASTKAGLANLFGGFMGGRQAPETQDARQQLRLFNQEVKRGLINNDKFPVREQEIVERMLPSADTFWQDPEQTAENIGLLRNFLETKLQGNERTLQQGNITTDKQGELADQNAQLRRLLELIDQPAGIEGQQSQGQPRRIRFDAQGNRINDG